MEPSFVFIHTHIKFVQLDSGRINARQWWKSANMNLFIIPALASFCHLFFRFADGVSWYSHSKSQTTRFFHSLPIDTSFVGLVYYALASSIVLLLLWAHQTDKTLLNLCAGVKSCVQKKYEIFHYILDHINQHGDNEHWTREHETECCAQIKTIDEVKKNWFIRSLKAEGKSFGFSSKRANEIHFPKERARIHNKDLFRKQRKYQHYFVVGIFFFRWIHEVRLIRIIIVII